jgi:hypothetical protein
MWGFMTTSTRGKSARAGKGFSAVDGLKTQREFIGHGIVQRHAELFVGRPTVVAHALLRQRRSSPASAMAACRTVPSSHDAVGQSE